MYSSPEELDLSADRVRSSLGVGSKDGGWLISVLSAALILKEFVLVVVRLQST